MATAYVRDGIAAVVTVHADGNHTMALHTGMAFPADAAVVRQFPDMFDIVNGVEQATAAPGEKRDIRRKK